jgi:ABC-type Fe3+/spermidine/putrescine transport system ATPase subunit
VRGVPPDGRRRQAREALGLVRLADKYDRRVHQLSGGERQRVALARALVTRPAILLLDEPLGALDEKLRLDMQVELRDLHAKLGMTFVYITHSQEEALTMSDRVTIMRRGRIEQEGAPRDLFDRPASRFVASFMGVENLLDGVVAAVDGRRVTLRAGTHALSGVWCGEAEPVPGAPACAGVRAERVRIADAADAGAAGLPNRIDCRLGGTVYKGKYFDQTAETDVGPIHARIWEHDADLPQPACLWWREEDCVVMPS